MSEPPIVKVPDKIAATRDAARDLLRERPDVSPTGAVYIDLKGVLGIGAAFVDELLAAWPLAQPVRASADVQDSWNLVVEHNESRARG